MITTNLPKIVPAITDVGAEKPKAIAHSLFSEVKVLEGEIKKSKELASEIENRGILDSIFSSTSKDMVNIAKAQNTINDRMFDLIQETIRLNVLSYAGLAALLDELRHCVEHGLVDANGKVIKLSDEGKELAEAATAIIVSILDGSKGTQDSITLTKESIEQLRREIELINRREAAQNAAITGLQEQVTLLSQQVVELRSILKQNRDAATSRFKILEQGHHKWRLASVAAAVVAIAWLALMTWFPHHPPLGH